MSKREREERSEDKYEKKLKEDPESLILRALKEDDSSRARKILCEQAQAFFDTWSRTKAEDWTNLLLGTILGYVDYVKVLIENGAD